MSFKIQWPENKPIAPPGLAHQVYFTELHSHLIVVVMTVTRSLWLIEDVTGPREQGTQHHLDAHVGLGVLQHLLKDLIM